jgi:hypothetical protein
LSGTVSQSNRVFPSELSSTLCAGLNCSHQTRPGTKKPIDSQTHRTGPGRLNSPRIGFLRIHILLMKCARASGSRCHAASAIRRLP